MRVLSLIVITAMVTFSLNAADLANTDLAGTWKGSMETQMGNTEVTVTFKPGEAVAGTVKVDQYDVPFEKARLDGDKISFEINIGHGKVVFEGTVAGDEMRLDVTGTQGSKYSLVCKRQK